MTHNGWLTTTSGDTQRKKERVSPENAVKIAEACEAHPVGALVARWTDGVDSEMADRDTRGNHDAFHTPIADLDAHRSNKPVGRVGMGSDAGTVQV